jgi:hypothetical protein
MATVEERAFPPGHPKAGDYKSSDPDAREWERLNIHPLGERAFPVDHPKAVDNPHNTLSRARPATLHSGGQTAASQPARVAHPHAAAIDIARAAFKAADYIRR